MKDEGMELLMDWKILLELNKIETTAKCFKEKIINQYIDKEELLKITTNVEEYMFLKIGEIDHGFKMPLVELELLILTY
jgi:hypothetical protein